MNSIQTAMSATNNFNMDHLAAVLSSVRDRIEAIPWVRHVEVVARRGPPATARVIMKAGTHTIATALSAESCKTACKYFQILECAPGGGQNQAAVFTSCRAC